MTAMTSAWVGYLALFSFTGAYLLVIFEEKIHMRKSKPVILIGCLMWAFIGIYEAGHGGGHAHDFVKELIAEIGELFFFLLVAIQVHVIEAVFWIGKVPGINTLGL